MIQQYYVLVVTRFRAMKMPVQMVQRSSNRQDTVSSMWHTWHTCDDTVLCRHSSSPCRLSNALHSHFHCLSTPIKHTVTMAKFKVCKLHGVSKKQVEIFLITTPTNIDQISSKSADTYVYPR